ncbi:hypothetical protein P2G74_01535 [Cronobacter muytjensii]|uniref:hypothetical protein n=1 Tax=Cronobacter muytjensii TaxID=413501 RepID=UPI002DB90953|nr:hypothetical protein [Cronobacter muytjensii]MEB8638654.1 hypothetical protein [Cronobacter muytjensii]
MITVDLSAMRELQASVGATESQFKGAFNKALKQTAARLYRESVALMLGAVDAKGKKSLGNRVGSFVERAVGGNDAGHGKIWFGLNDMPVSSLKGSLRNPRKIVRQRDAKGRFIKQRGARGATFVPRSSLLAPVSFPESFVATVRGKKSIWIRQGGFIAEAKIPVYEAMTREIAREISPRAGELLLSYFETDLRGRVAGGVK